MQKEIEDLVEEITVAAGFVVVDLRIVPGTHDGRGQLQLFCGDAPGGKLPGSGDCGAISKQVAYRLELDELESFFPSGYRLEVSTPGIFRKLKSERELLWAVGKSVRCMTELEKENAEGRKGETVTGILRTVAEHELRIDTEDGERVISRVRIQKIRLHSEDVIAIPKPKQKPKQKNKGK